MSLPARLGWGGRGAGFTLIIRRQGLATPYKERLSDILFSCPSVAMIKPWTTASFFDLGCQLQPYFSSKAQRLVYLCPNSTAFKQRFLLLLLRGGSSSILIHFSVTLLLHTCNGFKWHFLSSFHSSYTFVPYFMLVPMQTDPVLFCLSQQRAMEVSHKGQKL